MHRRNSFHGYSVARGLRNAARYLQLSARRVGRNADSRAALDDEYAARVADEVRTTFGDMRGAMAKLGQTLATFAYGLPEPARASLASMQSELPPMPDGVASRVIESELGRPPHLLFRTWDRAPIAAASIGQVHRAILPDGRPVAVKVQYPGLDRALGPDLANARLLGTAFAHFAVPGIDVREIVEILRKSLTEELDFRIEAERQTNFHRRWAHDPDVRVPAVIHHRSSQRVLVTEWDDGMNIDTFCAQADTERRSRAGEALLRFALEGIFRSGLYHADLHPGNVRFHTDGSISVLDYGLVQEWTKADRARFDPLLRAVLCGSEDVIAREANAAGIVRPEPQLRTERLASYLKLAYEPFRGSHSPITREWVDAAQQASFDFAGEYADVINVLNVPAPFVLVTRTFWGVLTMLATLNTPGRWGAILHESLETDRPNDIRVTTSVGAQLMGSTH